MNLDNIREDDQEKAAGQSLPDVSEMNTEKIEGWQEIEPGRFMPRRVRGSCRGLALG